MKKNTTITLYDMVISFPHAIDTLDRYNLDYYCGGAMPFLAACEEKKLDAAGIWAEILKANSTKTRWAQSWKEWEPDILSDVILRHYNDLDTRHLSVAEVLGRVMQECFKSEESKLRQVYSCFNNLSEELAEHMISEKEVLLHPLRSDIKGGNGSSGKNAGVEQMEKEHAHLGGLIKSLRHLTGNYNMRDFSSPQVQLAGIMLQELDKELTQRLHLENNILFPKIKKLNF